MVSNSLHTCKAFDTRSELVAGSHIVLRVFSAALYTRRHDRTGFMQQFSPDFQIGTGMQMFSGLDFETPPKSKGNHLVKATAMR